MNLKESTRNYNILVSRHYMIPESEMPLRIELGDDDNALFISLEDCRDEAKENNSVEDKVEKNGVRFLFYNLEVGQRTYQTEPAKFAILNGKEISTFISYEKQIGGVICIELLLMEKKEIG